MLFGLGVPRHQGVSSTGDKFSASPRARAALPSGTDSIRTRAEQFYSLYFAMTGLHALHMIVGLGIMTCHRDHGLASRRSTREHYTPLEVAGLYWHFVDIVWIFLFPLLYLIGGHY